MDRDLRHVVTGRKNWMAFAGRLYSLVKGCKLAGIQVEGYLRGYSCGPRSRRCPASRIAELTPWGWAEARAADLAAAANA